MVPAKDVPERREVSPEEYQHMVSSGQIMKPRRTYALPAALTGLVLIVLLVGFFSGVAYQKGKTGTTSRTAVTGIDQNGAMGANGFGGGMRSPGSTGEVTAVSDSSITVNNVRSGSPQTFKITGSTTVTDNGKTASVGDIETGDTVMIRTGSSDTGTVTSIMLNPSFGGAPANPTDPAGTTDTTDSGATI